MDIKVIDLDYHERDFEYAKAKYGVAFRRAEVAPGEKVYRLVELWEKTGPASLVTQVLGPDGSPMRDVDVAFYWPDAPDPPDPPTQIYLHDWYARFVHGLTGGTGDVGPGMGTGAYHGKGEGGPHAVWVRDPDIPSDICEKLGMLAGTPHDHLDQKFQLMTEPETGEEEPGTGELEIKYVLAEEWPSNMIYIAWPADLAFDTDVHCTSPGTPSHNTAPLEAWEYKGRLYALGGACADFDGDEPRPYSIWAYNLPDPEDKVTPVAEHLFQPRDQTPREKVIYVVDYTDGEPVPQPPPAPGGVAELFCLVADHYEAVAEIYRQIAALYAK